MCAFVEERQGVKRNGHTLNNDEESLDLLLPPFCLLILFDMLCQRPIAPYRVGDVSARQGVF